MTVDHLAISRKLADPKRLAKLLEALRAGQPPWTVGFMEPEATIRETLGFMGVVV